MILKKSYKIWIRVGSRNFICGIYTVILEEDVVNTLGSRTKENIT